jgi:hypothetical protein
MGAVAYIHYQFSPLDNISFRPAFFYDKEVQRTGTKIRYINFGIDWQNWFSSQIKFRPSCISDVDKVCRMNCREQQSCSRVYH